jgi:hypothetical protein
MLSQRVTGASGLPCTVGGGRDAEGVPMVEFDCGDCGTKLAAVASTLTPDGRSAGGTYPTLFLTCPDCGAAWEQDDRGRLLKKRDPL